MKMNIYNNAVTSTVLSFFVLSSVQVTFASVLQRVTNELRIVVPEAVSVEKKSSRTNSLNVEFISQLNDKKQYSAQTHALKANIAGIHSWSENLNGIYELSAELESQTQKIKSQIDSKDEEPDAFTFKIINVRPEYHDQNLTLTGLIVNQQSSQVHTLLDGNGVLGLSQSLNLIRRQSADLVEPTLSLELSGFQSQLLGYDNYAKSSALPQLFSESLVLKYQRVKYLSDLRATHFALQNADGELAEASGRNGNSVSGIQKENAQFTHKFSGYSVLWSQSWDKIRSLDQIQLDIEYLVNDKGQSGANESALYRVGVNWPTYRLLVSKYELGEQTLPAAMLGAPYNRVNVNGVSLEGATTWQDFTFSVLWAMNKPIVEKPFSQEEQIVYLKMEKSFEPF